MMWQIAFLRSIALHRPVGPHKHFQMPVVIADTQKALDYRYQRFSLRLRSSAAQRRLASPTRRPNQLPPVAATQVHASAAPARMVLVTRARALAPVRRA